MKKIISIVTLICLLVSFCGCGKNNDESNATTNMPQNKSEETSASNEDVFVDQDNIKISLKEKKKTGSSITLVIQIDNQSERDISVRTDSYSVNDYMLKGSDTESVLPGKKNLIEIFISDIELIDLKLHASDPYEFDFKIKVTDKNDSKWSIETDEITLYPNTK